MRYESIMEEAAKYVARKHPKAATPTDVVPLMLPLVQGTPEQECCWVLLLDVKNKVTDIRQVAQGTVDQATTSPRDILREAVRQGAPRLILVHNHPSGETSPSKQDIQITAKVVEAGRILDVEVLDHLIINNSGGYHSFREQGAI